MKKTLLLIAALLAGTAAMGLSQDTLDRTAPTVSVLWNDDHSADVLFTAGSNGAPWGFDIIWWKSTDPDHRHFVQFNITGNCSEYMLGPYQSVVVTIDPTQGNSECEWYLEPDARMNCDEHIRFSSRLHGWGLLGNKVSILMSPCE